MRVKKLVSVHSALFVAGSASDGRPRAAGDSSSLVFRFYLHDYRQALNTSNKARGASLDARHNLGVLHPTRERSKKLLQFHPSKVRAETNVLTDSEPHMTVRRAVDSEAPRLVEDRRVAIRRWIENGHRLAFGDRLAVYFYVPIRSSGELNER